MVAWTSLCVQKSLYKVSTETLSPSGRLRYINRHNKLTGFLLGVYRQLSKVKGVLFTFFLINVCIFKFILVYKIPGNKNSNSELQFEMVLLV